MSTSSSSLPSSHRALVLTKVGTDPSVTTISVPTVTSGSVIVKVLIANVLTYMRDIYNGKRQYPYPTPLVTGTSCIARIACLGPDTTTLTVGQLVHVDCAIRGRDDPSSIMLSGIFEGLTLGSQKLMRGEWKDSTYAEYAKVPLECVNVLDEAKLIGKPSATCLGYEISDLGFLNTFLGIGGLRAIDVKAGDTIIVSPATGSFGFAAVMLAVSLGARVIAMARNADAMKTLFEGVPRVNYVTITNDVAKDVAALKQHGPIDKFIDISPPEASKSTHIRSGIMSLREGGSAALMGGIREDISIPHGVLMRNNLTLKGKYMYDRSDIKALIAIITSGVLKLGAAGGLKNMGVFSLEKWDEAFTAAETAPRNGYAFIDPSA